MTNPPIPPIVPPAADDQPAEGTKVEGDELLDTDELLDERDDRPLDPDLDDDRQNSADADERAATEGTLDGDHRA